MGKFVYETEALRGFHKRFQEEVTRMRTNHYKGLDIRLTQAQAILIVNLLKEQMTAQSRDLPEDMPSNRADFSSDYFA